jgi:hypothetical protein
VLVVLVVLIPTAAIAESMVVTHRLTPLRLRAAAVVAAIARTPVRIASVWPAVRAAVAQAGLAAETGRQIKEPAVEPAFRERIRHSTAQVEAGPGK